MFFIKAVIRVSSVAVLITSSWQTAAVDFNELRKVYSQPSITWPKAQIEESVKVKEIGLLPAITFPKNNPYSKEKLTLGEMLFHDGKLSRSKQIACASCHDNELGWSDGKQTSFGHDRQRGHRNAPTIENVAFSKSFFWDGRAETLEQQALMPIQDPKEMNFSLPELIGRLAEIKTYRIAFEAAFGDDAITAKRIGYALATYQRTIRSRLSDFDRFLSASTQKNEMLKVRYRQSMSNKAIWGLHLFRTKAQCLNCHNGPTFSDQQFHNVGLTYYKRTLQDLGRYNVTKNTDDVGKFKTPSLRGVMNSKPWMHNGVFSDMTGLLHFYNAGGIKFERDDKDKLSPQTSPLLKPLSLTKEEIEALSAFLESITAPPAIGSSAAFIQGR